MNILGIDVGGSGIKGAPVDTSTGDLLAERYRIKTPKGAKPEPVAETVAKITRYFEWKGSIGIGFPAPIKGGVAMMAANISEKWVGANADELSSLYPHVNEGKYSFLYGGFHIESVWKQHKYMGLIHRYHQNG